MRSRDSILLFLTAVLAGFIVTEIIAIIGQVIGHWFVIGGRPRYYIVIGYVCALVIGFVFSGYLTSRIFQPSGRTRKELIAISAGAGYVIWWIWALFNPIDLGGDPFQRMLYTCAFLFINLIMALIVAFMSTTGAVLYVFSRPAPGTGKTGAGTEMQPPAIPEVRVRHFLLVIVLCLLLPTGLSCIGIASGMIDCDACMCDPWYAYCYGPPTPYLVNVTRLDTMTIQVTMTDEYSGGMWWRKLCAKPVGSLPLHVDVDGRDLSNQSVISAQGLADTVTPPEGITCYTEGATMTLSGLDLAIPGDRKPLINITSYYDPDQEWTIFYDVV